MNSRDKATLLLIGAIAVGAVAQGIVDHEAALLGLSMLEITLLGLVVGAAVRRAIW
jgi:F0F1-type ATP synthase assembly protein I